MIYLTDKKSAIFFNWFSKLKFQENILQYHLRTRIKTWDHCKNANPSKNTIEIDKN